MGDLNIKARRHHLKEEREAFPFLIPALIILGLISLYPLIVGVSRAVYTYIFLARKDVFVGFENFTILFRDPFFFRAFTNSLVWTVSNVSLQFILCFWLATMLNSRFLRFRSAFRMLILVPWATPPVVVGLMWRHIFFPGGPLDSILLSLGVLSPPNWLLDPRLALWTCIIANVWMGIPFMTVMLLAGLQTIDRELLEAAAIDGANYFQTLWKVILPSMKRIILIVLTLTTIWTFNMFDIVFVLTRGGPGNASLTLPLYSFQQAFWFFSEGAAAAIGVVTLASLLIVVVFYIREVFK